MLSFRSILNASIEESVRGILEEDGMVSGGRVEDIRSLVRLAKDLEFDDNESFFAKVVAVTEGRCGSKFMNDLLARFSLLYLSSICTFPEDFTHFIKLLDTVLPLSSNINIGTTCFALITVLLHILTGLNHFIKLSYLYLRDTNFFMRVILHVPYFTRMQS